MKFFFHLLAHFPLWVLHLIGAGLGWMAFVLSRSYRQRFLSHTRQAGYRFSDIWPALAHAGCMIAELPRLWLGRPLSYRVADQAILNAALARAQAEQTGLLILTPHLGCFEIAAQSLARDIGEEIGKPITVLYRPAKQRWLRDIMEANRMRPNLHTAPTNVSGVKQLMKALKEGEAVGLLPDQVPPEGMGIWVPFFQRPAYTMTLPARLIQLRQPVILLTWVKRLSWSRGFTVHYQSIDVDAQQDVERITTQLSVAIEGVIRKLPTQYIWEYNRYKAPKTM